MTKSGDRIAVIGAGYVGLTTAACLASLGHHVVGADRDASLIGRLRNGQVDILEPGLDSLVAEGLASGRLRFDVDTRDAVVDAETIFLCLPTPVGPDGAADITAVTEVAADIAGSLSHGSAVVVKSTVPPGTAARIAALLDRPDVMVVSNPEFLREGTTVQDFMHPDRIVVGCDDDGGAARVAGLYARLAAPVIFTSAASAELAKYAANCFLAVKLSYINEIASLCERTGADIGEVTEVLGHDPRIGASYLRPGPGWGGPCLPKDTQALLYVGTAGGAGLELPRAALVANQRQQRHVVDKVRLALGGRLAGTRIALLGLAYKPGTADLRDSPAIAVAKLLVAEQAKLTGYDPAVRCSVAGISVTLDPYETVADADAVIVLTDWAQFRALNWERIGLLMAGSTVVDTRNYLDPAVIDRAGLCWYGMGKSHPRSSARITGSTCSEDLRMDSEP